MRQMKDSAVPRVTLLPRSEAAWGGGAASGSEPGRGGGGGGGAGVGRLLSLIIGPSPPPGPPPAARKGSREEGSDAAPLRPNSGIEYSKEPVRVSARAA